MRSSLRMDADFASTVLTDLYRYPRKRLWLARLLWVTLGWFGAHRFYLGRYGSALLMMFTAGGFLIWWIVDAFLMGSMVRRHNLEQEHRRQAGLPPVELEFMPPLRKHVLQEPPDWTLLWQTRSPARRRFRFAGDLAVLVVSGVVLGSLAGTDGAEEAIVAIVVAATVSAMGGATAGLERFPLTRGLLRWSHRLRLFYYFNEPRTPPGLLLRSLTGAILAPFRRRDRAEVKLYLELGFVFTLVFLLMDLVEHVLVPLFTQGAPVSFGTLAGVWLREAAVTFFATYAFAAPIGAVLTLYLLTRRTHTVPRLLSALTFAAILVGATFGRWT